MCNSLDYCCIYGTFYCLVFDYAAPSLAVLRIGSMEVGALLNDAYKEYEVRICML